MFLILKVYKMLFEFWKCIKLFWNFENIYNCVCLCVKRKTLCNCLCSSSSCDSASLIQNIGEFGAKNYFTDHQTANTIQLFVHIKRKFFKTSRS